MVEIVIGIQSRLNAACLSSLNTVSDRMSTTISDVLTNVALPKTSATLTLRIIKSFEFRTERSLVVHAINLETTTVGELKEIARQGIISMLLQH